MTTIRKVLAGAGALVAAAVVWGVWSGYPSLRRAADMGTGVLAKQMCSCVFVANRSVDDCRADQFESTDPIGLEVLHDEERVRAWLPGLGERTAIHREGLGCAFE